VTPRAHLQRLADRADGHVAVLLAWVAGGGARAFAVGLAVGRDLIEASPTFSGATAIAPIYTWAALFAVAGGLVLMSLWRSPDELALAEIALAGVTLVWAAAAAVSVGEGGLTTAPIAFLVIAAFEGVAALAASLRAKELRAHAAARVARTTR